jgi:DNA polymerase III epsilon subunit family exonuclease
MSVENSIRRWHDYGPFTIFDIETTGMSPVYDRIVEIAAIKVELDGTQKRFHSLVNPECFISKKLTRIHGITNEMVAGAPCFRNIGEDFLEFSEASTLVAHNARFDLGFLQESLNRDGIELWKGKTLDSIPLIKQAYPGLPSYSLSALRHIFGLNYNGGPAHRAFADVEWTLEIFSLAMKKLIKM